MSAVSFPPGYRIEGLRREHPRRKFMCGNDVVDDWLRTKALQHQSKHLSITRLLLDAANDIVGYYTLATGQVDFSDLPADVGKNLPRRMLPIAKLAWFGIHQARQGEGWGGRLLSQALADCFHAGKTFAFVAVTLDAIDEASRQFYKHYDFRELPGQPFRLFLSTAQLNIMMVEG